MTIWMDMTNSLFAWSGGVVGIVRAELELAKGLKKINADLRVCYCNNIGFAEIPDAYMAWLWNADNAGDSYMAHMGRINPTAHSTAASAEFLPQGLENAYAYSDSRRERLLRAMQLVSQGRRPFVRKVLRNLWRFPIKPMVMLASAAVRMKKRPKIRANTLPNVKKKFSHPFKEGDLIFSCGWHSSLKELILSKIKCEMDRLDIVYLVYDIILLQEGVSHLYHEGQTDTFKWYFEWIGNNCSMVLYGGETSQKNAEAYRQEKGLHNPPGTMVKFGSNVLKTQSGLRIEDVRKKYDIHEKYIISVGSVEPRKNYATIYKAYKILLERGESLPELVIVGARIEGEGGYLINDPQMVGYINVIQPTDAELDVLYKNCLFALLPSLYEGWSLTLPEALGYGKLCICADIPPLREIAGDLIVYVDPINPIAWGQNILRVYRDDALRGEYEQAIARTWTPITWSDSAVIINDALCKYVRERADIRAAAVYMDLSYSVERSFAGEAFDKRSREELTIARHLGREYPNLRFFVMNHLRGVCAIDRGQLQSLLGTMDIQTVFIEIQKLHPINITARTYAKSLMREEAMIFSASVNGEVKAIRKCLSVERKIEQKRRARRERLFNLPFGEDDIIINAGCGYDPETYEILLERKKAQRFKVVQIVYDNISFIAPQVAEDFSRERDKVFFTYTAHISDRILYTGNAAQADGNRRLVQMKLPMVASGVIYPGREDAILAKCPFDDDELLEQMGITKDYIFVCDTYEALHNPEVAYLAYLDILRDGIPSDTLPQLVYSGFPDKKTAGVLSEISRDERMRNLIVHCVPNDIQRDLLYRRCLFTIMPHTYEGWPTELLQSLHYGKFSVVSDIPPFRDVGADLIEYVSVYKTRDWADTLLRYISDREAIRQREMRISQSWKAPSWRACAKQIIQQIESLAQIR